MSRHENKLNFVQAFVTMAVRRPPLLLSCQDESLLVLRFLVPDTKIVFSASQVRCDVILTGTEWYVLTLWFLVQLRLKTCR